MKVVQQSNICYYKTLNQNRKNEFRIHYIKFSSLTYIRIYLRSFKNDKRCLLPLRTSCHAFRVCLSLSSRHYHCLPP
ncbi:Envelope glycoprotein I, partial [Frankliniella fusca]